MSVKITIAVCQIEVYCGFQKAAVTGLSYTQADYADMIMLLCILEANKHTYTRQTHSEVSILTSCHNKLPLADENSYYPYYNSLPLVFTLFFHFWICEVFTNSLFFLTRHGHIFIKKQNGLEKWIGLMQTGSRESKGMFSPNTLRIYTGFNCCGCLCVPRAV